MEKTNNVEEKDNNRNKAMVLIIGIATLLIALIGATFAYFTAVVEKTNGDQSVMITTTEIQGITYTASDPIKIENAVPGAFATATFTVTNPNTTATASYTLEFVTDSNTFTVSPTDAGDSNINGQLVLTVSGGQLVGNATHDYTNGDTSKWTVASNVELAAGITDEYNVRLDFIEASKNQNANQGKNFVGHFEVTQSIITASQATP